MLPFVLFCITCVCVLAIILLSSGGIKSWNSDKKAKVTADQTILRLLAERDHYRSLWLYDRGILTDMADGDEYDIQWVIENRSLPAGLKNPATEDLADVNKP